MSFGQRTAGQDHGSETEAAPRSAGLVFGMAGAAAIAVVAAIWAFWPEADTRGALAAAAERLGVTEAVRGDLRQRLQAALIDMHRDPCDEGLRDRAGRAAVAYYETLLEKPVTAAGLEVTYDRRCRTRGRGTTHPFELIVVRHGVGSFLRLPWDCLPEAWRTPADRALQERLERSIASGRLPSDSLSGTLALVAPSWHGSSTRSYCKSQSASSSRGRTSLPLLANHSDDGDQGRRRR